MFVETITDLLIGCFSVADHCIVAYQSGLHLCNLNDMLLDVDKLITTIVGQVI